MKQPPSEDAMELAIKLFPTAGDDDLDIYATQIDAFAARKVAKAVAAYEEWANDVCRLTRELDVEMNGDGAATQASLCDLIGEHTRRKAKAVAVAVAEAERGWRDQDIEARALIRRAAELIKTSANVGGTGKSLAELEVEADDPQWDGTDAAHPAWWRGNDRGCRFVTQRLTDALDGKDDGAGWIGYPPLEALRRRLLDIADHREVLPP